MTSARIAGFGLGFLGVIVLIGPGALFELGDGGSLVRQGAVLAGALCYAANTILTRRLIDTHPLVSAAGVLLVATLVIVPVAVLVDSPLSWSPSGGSLAAIAWLGLVPTAAATILYFRLVASAGPTFLSLVNYPVPVVAVATGALVYTERLGGTALAGLALILSGIWLSQLVLSAGEEASPER